MTNSPRILCVSLNPSIDRRIWTPRLDVGEVNRASRVEPAVGGKAAHVAFAAKALDAEVRWLGLLGGPEGDDCLAGLQARSIEAVRVSVSGRTRTNLEIINESNGEITEILEPGPVVSEFELAAFLREFAREVGGCSIVVASGSLPPGIPVSAYADLVAQAKSSARPILLDASQESLACALAADPTLIKPNRQEAEALLDRKIQTVNEAVDAAQELQRRGPKTVIISLGAEGAVAVDDDDDVLHATAPQLTALSTVGSGDSFLAGWAVAALQGRSPEERLRLAVACGAANCLADSPGMISAETVRRLSAQVEIHHWTC